MYLHYPN